MEFVEPKVQSLLYSSDQNSIVWAHKNKAPKERYNADTDGFLYYVLNENVMVIKWILADTYLDQPRQIDCS